MSVLIFLAGTAVTAITDGPSVVLVVWVGALIVGVFFSVRRSVHRWRSLL